MAQFTYGKVLGKFSPERPEAPSRLSVASLQTDPIEQLKTNFLFVNRPLIRI